MTRTILVATDGTPAALGALRLAKELDATPGVQVHVIGVIEPVPVFDAGFMVVLPEMELFDSRRKALKEEIAGQVSRVAGQDHGWSISVQAGIPGPRIVALGEEVGAEAILLGLGRHGPMDRVFGTETALQVLRVSHIPVLAVPHDADRLPRSAVLGVDFSSFSHRAARIVLGLLREPWEMHAVHVLSGMEFLPTLSEDWREEYEGELRERMDELCGALPIPSGCETRIRVLEGDPSHQLMSFAKTKGAELLVVGSHGHSFVGRLLQGSVSTRLVRSAQIPVLVVPPPERSEEVMAEEAGEGETSPWVEELNQFTKLNAGRQTTLELDDPELGKQECGRNFPLWGVDYDAKKDRINIMLGRSGTVEGHLTHSLPAPQVVEITRDEEGRAEALKISFRTGKAVLRIHRD